MVVRKEVIFREVEGRKEVMPLMFQEMMRRDWSDGLGVGEDTLDGCGAGDKIKRRRFKGGGLSSGIEGI